ncbi:unnamed protein product [Moneuplotes crassus]|uniref:Uncharacterized protein n=1 Tax=Euplotes crassus TaxID=5936 RepID=A0AAD1U768_EUPCR|nr:unnamed protein product [Moneuplotes crassus]
MNQNILNLYYLKIINIESFYLVIPEFFDINICFRIKLEDWFLISSFRHTRSCCERYLIFDVSMLLQPKSVLILFISGSSSTLIVSFLNERYIKDFAQVAKLSKISWILGLRVALINNKRVGVILADSDSINSLCKIEILSDFTRFVDIVDSHVYFHNFILLINNINFSFYIFPRCSLFSEVSKLSHETIKHHCRIFSNNCENLPRLRISLPKLR